MKRRSFLKLICATPIAPITVAKVIVKKETLLEKFRRAFKNTKFSPNPAQREWVSMYTEYSGKIKIRYIGNDKIYPGQILMWADDNKTCVTKIREFAGVNASEAIQKS